MGRTWLGLGLCIQTCLSFCCSPDQGPTEETYIPIISNSWTEIGNPNHRFNLTAGTAGVSAGTFGGQEVRNNIVISDSLFGNFSNRNITFTVRKGTLDTLYVGRFTADTLIDLGRFKISHGP